MLETITVSRSRKKNPAGKANVVAKARELAPSALAVGRQVHFRQRARVDILVETVGFVGKSDEFERQRDASFAHVVQTVYYSAPYLSPHFMQITVYSDIFKIS